MKKTDVIFSIFCALAVAWIGTDFLSRYGWLFFIVLPVLSVIGFLLCDILGRKYLFVRQAGKFILAGAFADVIDIKVFQLLFWILPFSLFFKGISFITATAIKYFLNKHWTFEKHEKEEQGREAVIFFIITLVGLVIDVISFYYLSRIQTGISGKLWVESSIILAALITAVWNFLGYKFLVFKK